MSLLNNEDIFKEFGKNNKDSGSTESQIALFSSRIKSLSEHLKDNAKDLVDIPKKVTDDIKITPLDIVDEVLKIALTKELKKVEWTEIDNVSGSKSEEKSQAIIQ